jgi:hypothetical protein
MKKIEQKIFQNKELTALVFSPGMATLNKSDSRIECQVYHFEWFFEIKYKIKF